MTLVGVYGASGFGREVMPLARACAPGAEIVFVDDGAGLDQVNGHEVLSYDAFIARRASDKRITVAIADGTIRRRLFERCEQDGIGHFEALAPSAIRGDACTTGPGMILCANTMLTANCTVGRGFHANIYSYVAHDCVIGDFVTFAPAVKCNGNVRVEDGAYIGTGAILKQGKPGDPLVIGAGAVVGMGAVVTKSVPPNTTVIGNPARPLVR